MTESKLSHVIKETLEDLTEDIVEERVVAYVVNELHLGRGLTDILKDPYIGNRFDDEKITGLLANKEIIEAVEQELNKALNKDL